MAHKVAHAVAASWAPIGASFTGALVTGSLWGADVGHLLGVGPAPHLGAILFFLYLGYMGLRGAIEDMQRADRASAVLAVVGVVNVPIIHYSVTWWNSLHQAPSVMKLDGPTHARLDARAAANDAAGFTLLFVRFAAGAAARRGAEP